ncbi:MAG TPA: hypothetical protein VEU47_11020 [Candidatus Cybelea sp.]|nr:hypothetical protein [Candidatus Cybelea sp.]
MEIKVFSTEREVLIKFNGITHFRCDRRRLIGLQSWIVDRGRVTPVYVVQIYIENGPEISLEYDNREKWAEVLNQLDTTPFLNEWKVQDP